MVKINSLTFTNPSTLSDPRPYGYSHVAQFPGDWKMIMVAGQVGGTADNPQYDTDFRKQLQQALENTRLALESAGATLKDIAKFVIYIVDYDNEKFNVYQDEMKRIWGDQCPAGTLVPVQALAVPGILVEFDVTAAVPNT